MTAALTCVALAVTISVTLAPRVSAQTAAANATFDVASVKPNKSGDGRVPPQVDPNLPSLFTALQEQLGLKLESQRGPVEVVVIDRVEQPTED
jgi:hypothetical protein